MRKKIIFVCNNLHIGGIQRSLVNLLSEISGRYDVTLFLFSLEGDYTVPENVRVIAANRAVRILGMSQAEANAAGFLTGIWRGAFAALTRITGCALPFRILTGFQKLPEEYDAAVSFMQKSAFRYFYGGCNEFVIRSVRAKRKISFVHCDFEHYFGNNRYNRAFYRNFDVIACVSDSCRAVFNRVCPELSPKTAVVHNCFDYDEIRSLSEEYTARRTEGRLNLFTAARLSPEKGILRMMGILQGLKEQGLSFVWRIAGDGEQMEECRAECQSRGLSDCVHFLGLFNNPYPYFKAADLILVPSYDEAAPMVFGEAAALGVPVLTTNTVSAVELVQKRNAGFVCENSEEGIRQTLKTLLENPECVYQGRYAPAGDNAVALAEFDAVICGGTL